MTTILPEMSVENIRDFILSEANNYALKSVKDSSSPSTEFRLRKELNQLRHLSRTKTNALNKLKDAFAELSKQQSSGLSLRGTTLNEIRLEFKSQSVEDASLLLEKLEESISHYENTLTRELEQKSKLQYMKNREKKMAQAIHKKLDGLSSMYDKYVNLCLEAKMTQSTAGLLSLHEQFRSEYTDKQVKEEETSRLFNLTHLRNIDRRLKERILRAANLFARSVFQESQDYKHNSSLISQLETAISQRQFFKESLETQESQLKELEQEFTNLKDSIGIQADIRDPEFMKEVSGLWEDLKHSELLLQNRYAELSKSYYKLTAELELLRTELDTANESVSIFKRFSLVRDKAHDVGLGAVTENLLVQMKLTPRVSTQRIESYEKLVMTNFSFLHLALLKIIKKLIAVTNKARYGSDLMGRIQSIASDTFMNSLRKKEGVVRRVSVQKQKHRVIAHKEVSSVLLLADMAAPASIMGLKFSELLSNNAFFMTFIKRSSAKSIIARFRPIDESNILETMKEISEICSSNAQTKLASIISKTQDILTLVAKETASINSEENRIRFDENKELRMSRARINNLIKQIFTVKCQMIFKNKKLKKEDVANSRFRILPLLFDRSPTDEKINLEFKNKIKFSKTCEKLPQLVKSEDFKSNIKISKSHLKCLRSFGNNILLAKHNFTGSFY